MSISTNRNENECLCDEIQYLFGDMTYKCEACVREESNDCRD